MMIVVSMVRMKLTIGKEFTDDDDGGDGYDDGDEYAKYAHDRGSEIFDDDFSNSTIQIPRMAMTVP